jgi:hypothetical protein
MIKKILAGALLAVAVTAPLSALAYEYDKKVVQKEVGCKYFETDTAMKLDLIHAMKLENTSFENDEYKGALTNVLLKFNNWNPTKAQKKYYAEHGIMSDDGDMPAIFAVQMKVENKTDQPQTIDLNYGQITIGSFQGRGVQAGTKFANAANTPQAPIMVFPKSSKDFLIYRTDFKFYGDSLLWSPRWLPPADLKTDKNLLGDLILKIDDKYITLSPSLIIDSSKLHWQKVPKEKK